MLSTIGAITASTAATAISLVNNVYKPGPATRHNVRARIPNPSKGGGQQRWWFDGYLVVGSPEVTADNWLGFHPNKGDTVDFFRADGSFEAAPVTTHSARETYELLKDAGAALPRRDSLDARIVEEVRTGMAKMLHEDLNVQLM